MSAICTHNADKSVSSMRYTENGLLRSWKKNEIKLTHPTYRIKLFLVVDPEPLCFYGDTGIVNLT